MDIVFVEGLKVDTVIGIYDWEKKIRQDIVLDIEMSSDIAAAAKTDHIDQALNYKSVCKRVASQIILNEFDVQWVKLTLNKGEAITGASGVGVIIERTKSL